MYCPSCLNTDKVSYPHKFCRDCDRRIRREKEIMWKHHSLNALHKAQLKKRIDWYKDNFWAKRL